MNPSRPPYPPEQHSVGVTGRPYVRPTLRPSTITPMHHKSGTRRHSAPAKPDTQDVIDRTYAEMLLRGTKMKVRDA